MRQNWKDNYKTKIPHTPLDSFPPDADSGFACESKEKAFFGALSLKQLESANPVQSRQQQDYVGIIRMSNGFCLITEVTEGRDLETALSITPPAQDCSLWSATQSFPMASHVPGDGSSAALLGDCLSSAGQPTSFKMTLDARSYSQCGLEQNHLPERGWGH